jgi:hypothetical protein
MNFTMRSNDPDERAASTIDLAAAVDEFLGGGGFTRTQDVPLVPDEKLTGPRASDRLVRRYQTVVGGSTFVFRVPDEDGDGPTYVLCTACSFQQDFSYGWDEKAFAAANEHAANCRAVANMER